MWIDGGDGCAPFITFYMEMKYLSLGRQCMCICMYIVHISIYNSRVDGDDLPPRLVADPVEGVKGRISTVSSQTGKIL